MQGRLYDVLNNANSPYQQRTLFAVALAGQVPVSGTVTVLISSDLWLGTTPVPGGLLIDFGDGLGPREVAMNSKIEVTYDSEKLTPSHLSSPVFQPSNSDLDSDPDKPLPVDMTGHTISVTNPATGLRGLATLRSTRPLAVLPDMVLGLHASHTWGSQPAGTAVGWVKWGMGNTSGKFRKPLVFVEGIDFGCDGSGSFCGTLSPGQTGPIASNSPLLRRIIANNAYRNGSAGWNEMVEYNEDFSAVEKLPTLRDQLYQQGYDIVYLDFSDGATHIQTNAMTLVELLDYINSPANHTADATETVVAAASMGGQVARFALAWMEQQSLCHNAKLYISIDSPHRGANIPIGVQCLIDRLNDVVSTFGQFDLDRDKLLRPAAKQMLVYHFSPDANGLRLAWQAWQASPDSYPGLLRKVAIADGNRLGQALPGAFPGMELLTSSNVANVAPIIIGGTIGGTIGGPFGGVIGGAIGGLFGWGQNVANSLPGASSRGNDNVVFRFKRPYSLSWNYTQVPPHTPEYDQAPGGTRSTMQDAQKASYGLLRSGYDNHAFIPITSALDITDAGAISTANIYYNVDANIPRQDRPSFAYAFEAYYAPQGISEPHINITNGQPSQYGNPTYASNNSDWIVNELRESAHNLPAVLTAQNGPYNYGSLYRRLLPSVEVGQGGQLFINNASLPNSGGVNTANDLKESDFEVYTSSCGSIVRVDQGGTLTLGQANDLHTGTLRIANNSLLDLQSGSQTVVNAGSVLRIQKGATLVVRSGATLSVLGRVIVEPGAYICLENTASIVTSGTGAYDQYPDALGGVSRALLANPTLTYLSLGTLACIPVAPVAPLQVTLSPYATATNACRTPSGGNNFAQWTAVASGGIGNYSFTWYLDPSGTGSNFQPATSGQPGMGSTVTAGNTFTFGLCLNGYSHFVAAKVVVTSRSQQASATSFAIPQTNLVLYPNPADSYVDVAADAVTGDSSSPSLAAGRGAQPAASAGSQPPVQVTVFNGQGTPVFTVADLTTPSVRLPVATWPNGLYQVRISCGPAITTRALSIQH